MTRYITDEQIDEALREIDSIAREFDHYEYGLPLGDIDDGNPNAKMRDVIRAVLTLAAPAPAVPKGWRLVPIEPDPKMLSEGSCAHSLPGPHYIGETAAKLCWDYMIASAPTPPAQAEPNDWLDLVAAAVGEDAGYIEHYHGSWNSERTRCTACGATDFDGFVGGASLDHKPDCKWVVKKEAIKTLRAALTAAPTEGEPMPTKDSPPLPPSEYALKLPNDVDGNIEYVPAFTLNQLHERDAIWQAKLDAAREAQAPAVPSDEPAEFERAYNRLFRGRGVDTRHISDCEAVWMARAALTAAPTPPAQPAVPESAGGAHSAMPYADAVMLLDRLVFAAQSGSSTELEELLDKCQKALTATPAVPMTEIDFQDDDALRFAQRVLESDAPPSDRKAARDMLVAIRTRVRKAHAAKKGGA